MAFKPRVQGAQGLHPHHRNLDGTEGPDNEEQGVRPAVLARDMPVIGTGLTAFIEEQHPPLVEHIPTVMARVMPFICILHKI